MKEVFRPEKGLRYPNIGNANKRIAELEAELQNKRLAEFANKPPTATNTPAVEPLAPLQPWSKDKDSVNKWIIRDTRPAPPLRKTNPINSGTLAEWVCCFGKRA